MGGGQSRRPTDGALLNALHVWACLLYAHRWQFLVCTGWMSACRHIPWERAFKAMHACGVKHPPTNAMLQPSLRSLPQSQRSAQPLIHHVFPVTLPSRCIGGACVCGAVVVALASYQSRRSCPQDTSELSHPVFVEGGIGAKMAGDAEGLLV